MDTQGIFYGEGQDAWPGAAFFFGGGANLWYMEVPRLGVELEL